MSSEDSKNKAVFVLYRCPEEHTTRAESQMKHDMLEERLWHRRHDVIICNNLACPSMTPFYIVFLQLDMASP